MNKSLLQYLMIVLLIIFLVSCSVEQDGEITPDVLQKTEKTQTAEIVAEAQAGIHCDLPLPGPDDWPVVLCEQFNDNTHGWNIEVQDNPYAAYESVIDSGKFVVNYKAKGFAGYQRSALTWFPITEEKNFTLSIIGLIDSSFHDVSWGIAFRGEGDDFFLFSIMNSGKYKFEIYEDGNWIPLITPKTFSGIHLGEENKLRIEAGGQDFYFSINDTMVNQFNGALLEGDEIQLIVSAKEGVQAVFSFDDVVLQK